MKRNKVVEIIMSLLVKLNIKDKKVKWAVALLLGIALAVATQIGGLEGDVEGINPKDTDVSKVIEGEVKKATDNVVEEFIKNLF